MKAYVSLLSTDSYYNGILTLYQSLKNSETQFPLYVIVNENISKATKTDMARRGIFFLEYEKLSYSQENINHMLSNGWGDINLANTLDKLRIFSLTQFEKIVYLDSDILVLKNIDDLFNWPHGSAVVDTGKLYDLYPDKFNFIKYKREDFYNFNSGLLVIEPNINDYNKIIELSKENFGYDQELIRLLWNNWINEEDKHIPKEYNIFAHHVMPYLQHGLIKLRNIKVIHYANFPKPYMQKGFKIGETKDFLRYYYVEIMNQAIFEN